MIQFSFSVLVSQDGSIEELTKKALGAKEVKKVRILKKSIDARKKDAIKYLYQVAVETDNDKKYIGRDVSFYEEKEYDLSKIIPKKTFEKRPVVVGTGPAGLFCALVLSYAGAKPVVIERGQAVDDRQKDIQHFFDTLELDTESNVQFGEGGAGTFSDGKLNTNTHNGYIPYVLTEFVKAGAPEEILYLAKPHVGTDYLRDVVKNMRTTILQNGGEIFYQTKLTDIVMPFGKVQKVVTNKGTIETDKVFLAVGHSARDVFEMLNLKNVKMESKTFSMGVRIEHLREMINISQYGNDTLVKDVADYKLASITGTGKSLYTFCMCPGGRVINASSEEGGVCVNGMSYFARNDTNSNSALLVNVGVEDWKSEHPLAGVEFQRKYERATFSHCQTYKPVVQLYGDLVKNKVTSKFGAVLPSVETGYVCGDLRACLPKGMIDTIVDGVKIFGRKLRGFDREDSVLTGIEGRSSSPVRILRDDTFLSSVEGLYPLGEGAGYAGGITSASVDGIKVALSVLQ